MEVTHDEMPARPTLVAGGTFGSVTPVSRSSRRLSSTRRRPPPQARPSTPSPSDTAATPAAPSRKPRREPSWSASSARGRGRPIRAVSALRTTSQVTKPITRGRYDVVDGGSWAATAATPTAASRPNTTTGAHQWRAASQPAKAKSSASTTRIPVISTGLSLKPSTPMARSTTSPGVRVITSSATDTTGELRTDITFAVA